jgi:hypothetical protein
MAEHVLKSWPEYFVPIRENAKLFDLRKDDRKYAVGDIVLFCEYQPKLDEYTNKTLRRTITYILRDFPGLMPGYCILGIGPS